MFREVWRLRARLAAFALSFLVGLLVAAAFRLAAGLLVTPQREGVAGRAPKPEGCAPGESFDSPSDVLIALRSGDVSVRADAFRRLFLRPGVKTVYYDFQRDRDYPEIVDRPRLRLVNLDESPEPEALVTFVRMDSPVAVVLKRGECGWRASAAVSSWLRYEDYPYDDWFETVEPLRPGQHALLVRDSKGDATGYTRRARILRFTGDRLEEVAEVEEERIGPLEGYHGKDWSRVKQRRVGNLRFTQESGAEPARLYVAYRETALRYTGVEPSNVYWREADGVWHQSRRHWRARSSETFGETRFTEEQFVWSEQQNRFVRAGS